MFAKVISAVICISCLVFSASAQEDPKTKRTQPHDTTIYPVDSAAARKGQMPVAVPDDKKPASPLPTKQVRPNEDGMPVINPADSTMKKPQR
jgi:hypothetical protein